MKKFFLSFAMGLSTLMAFGQSYDKMWAEVQQLHDNGKPQSAYAATEKILRKALAEGQKGQALSARLRAAGLHQQWAPDSFFTDVAELEHLRSEEQRPEARAIYASILAEVYQSNSHRAQARNLQLTSDEMKEWTEEQYDSAAVKNWRLSLADIPALATAKSKDWLPFIEQNKNSAYFGHDLLHILWQRARDQRRSEWSQAGVDLNATLDAIIDVYRRQGNREAELLLEYDRISLATTGFWNDDSAIEPLLRLKERFADLPPVVEVYHALTDNASEKITTAQRVAWAKEAISRFPKYERIGNLRYRLNELQRPSVTWRGLHTCYPHKTYTWKLTTQNAAAVELAVYRLRNGFKEDDISRSKLSAKEFLRRNATLVQTIKPALSPGLPFEQKEDSLKWTAPDAGFYAILYSATTAESEALRKTSDNQFQLLNVTQLKTMTRFTSVSELQVVVVDAESGHPLQGANVTLHNEDPRTGQHSRLAVMTTDAEGRAIFRALPAENRRRLVLEAATASDHYLPKETLWANGAAWHESQPLVTRLELYTDRAIYRPGQTVHVSGIAYAQEHWEAKACEGKTYELRLRDANWKEVGKLEVTTDAMGVLTADFTLPEGGLPGYYQIQCDGANVGFRVEEYKRPTFEVKMDEAPALQWPQDSITLTGKAVGYNGVPVRNARVTGNYQFTYPYIWWFRHDDSPQLPIDTIETDDQGAFLARVPLKDVPAEALEHGLVLRLNVEVLSATGETREGSMAVPLCTTPLRLNISMREQQDRDRLQPPAFTLLTSTGKPVEGDIRCAIYTAPAPSETLAENNAGTFATASSETFTATAVVPDISVAGLETAIRALPSGDYELRATATAGSDTATATARFYVFSMADTRLPHHVDSWLYCPTDSFDAAHPARIQVGSSFDDVALYYTLVGKEGIIKDELISLSDELRIFEIPYLPDYGDGVNVHFAFVKHGSLYAKNKALKLTVPDSQLRWQWTSFRNYLHPGDHETWTLKLTTPDGKPANANLMATLYDASLDQLTPHSWSLLVNRYHHLRAMPWRSQDIFGQEAFQHLYFAMKDYKTVGLLFDVFGETWLQDLTFPYYRFGRSRRMMKSARVGGIVAVEESAMMNDVAIVGAGEAPMMMAAKATMASADSDAIEEESAADEGVVTGGSAADSPTIAPASTALRTNFNETAAFMPRLHSNPKTGEVAISFTLPESLTTWQLLGVAHSKDMLTANIQAQTIARKELMARLFMPRFLRAGDQGSIRASVQNLTDSSLSGKARLEVFDPETERLILTKEMPFEAAAGSESILAFDYTPTEDYPIVAVRFTAMTTPVSKTKGKRRKQASETAFSDGEQHYLPILSSKEHITESIEIQADGEGSFTTDLTPLFNHDAVSATQRRLTVEYTTHPIWNVVQALPALREPQYDDVLSLTSVFYANALSAHIAATTPRLRDIIALWKQQASTSEDNAKIAGKSPLARNEELKQIILDETPWLRDADSDSERRAQLIDLFNENLIDSRLSASLEKLQQRQEHDGGFSWFPGMRSSEMMTRLVCIELTRLRSLTSDFSSLNAALRTQTDALLQRAFVYIAQENAKAVKEMKEAEAKGATINTGSLMHLDYIYIAQRSGVKLTKAQQADVSYLLDHLKGSVAGMSNDERAVAAIVLKGAGRDSDSQLYFDSMREHMTTTAAHGTFFDYAGGSFTPTGHKVIIHTAAMEAARELAPADKVLNSGLRRWLLQQKRTQMWESSICTVNAIYALLHGSAATADVLSADQDRLTLDYGKRKVAVEPSATPAAMGYVKQTYTDGAAPKSIRIQRTSPTEAWGAVYAQYLTPVADASAQASGLTIRRELSSTTPRLGDKFTTRYIITADRDYEYVCLRADRPAAAEPAEQLSGYRYQGGLGYYCAVRDAHTDYFFDSLPKGTYVLEETAFIDREGHYTTGLCRLQCLYAPEYEGHTAAAEIRIE